MIRRILITFLMIGLVGGIIYVFFQFRQQKQPMSNAFNAIPASAALIIQTTKIKDVSMRLQETNIMWEELQTTQLFQKLQQNLELLDTLYKNHPEIRSIVDNRPIIASAHMSGATNFDYLYLFSIPSTYLPASLLDLPNKATMNIAKITNKVYDGVTIYTLKPPLIKEVFSYAIHDGVFIASLNTMLVEESIRQINKGTSILNEQGVKYVQATAGQNNDANIYINPRLFPKMLGTVLNPSSTAIIKELAHLADWIEVDLKIKPNYLMLNGFTYANDSANHYLNLYTGQKPQDAEIVKIIPHNTATFIHFSFSDFKKLRGDLETYLEKKNELFEHKKKIQLLNEEFRCDIESLMLTWIDNEMAVVFTEPHTDNFLRNAYIIFKSGDIDEAQQRLKELTNKIEMQREEPTDTSFFKNHEISHINIPNLFETLFGSLFSEVKYNHYTIIEDYVVFGNSANSLNIFITDYLADKTLHRDLHFANFTESLSSESNIFIYSNIARSPNLYKSFLNKEYAADVESHKELYRKFEAIAIQITQDDNQLFYNNVFLKHNPVYKQETTSLWESILDTVATSFKPFLHLNHYNQTQEVVIQDSQNKLYLLSPTGKVQWKVQLDEPIISEIKQIDAYKNSKLQMVFNSAKKLYLLDRNGIHVDGFPITLKDSATAGLTVVDYDGNKKYRIFVPTGKTIACFDGKGIAVKGWIYNGSSATINLPVQYFNLDNKDYLITINSDGIPQVLNRKGEQRIELENQFKLSPNAQFYIDEGKNISNSCLLTTDSTGKIIRLFFSDVMDTVDVGDFSENHHFVYHDVNGDQRPEYTFTDGRFLKVFTGDKELLFEYDFDSTISTPPQFFQFPEGKIEVGVTSSKTNEIYLFDDSGMLHDGFPLFGSMPFSVADINKDGSFNLLVNGKDKLVYAYGLE